MRSPWMALADGLADLEAGLARLDDAAFARDASEDADGPADGVRRCLAQFEALESGLRTRWVPDATRLMRPSPHPDRRAAMYAVRHATWRALSLHGVAPDAPVAVETSFEPGAPPFAVPSSAGRELALLVRHVHAVAVSLRKCCPTGDARLAAAPARVGAVASTVR